MIVRLQRGAQLRDDQQIWIGGWKQNRFAQLPAGVIDQELKQLLRRVREQRQAIVFRAVTRQRRWRMVVFADDSNGDALLTQRPRNTEIAVGCTKAGEHD